MFVLSKILWPLIAPDALLLIALALGTALLFTRWRRAGRAVLVVTVAAALLVAVLPTGSLMLTPLEDRFPPVTLPDRIDGIVVLGGAISPRITKARGKPALKDTAERMTEFVALARIHPEARLVFTGGSGSLIDQDLKEAPVARAIFASLGLDVTRIEFEDRSRNTYENALYTKELMQPKPGETWVVITSAFHMPRAMGCFSRVGWKVLPYPVDYMTTGDRGFDIGFSLAGSLSALDFGIHEWVGLIAYRIAGYTDALFPAP